MAVTLLTYRQALARALDDIEVHIVASATPSTMVVTSTINAIATASATRYDDRWVYINSGAAAGQQRHVVKASFAPLTGGMQITPQWTTTPSAGQGVEFTGLFPAAPGTFGADTDYRSCINRALRQVLCEDRITDSITTSATYDQTSRPWFDRPDRLIQALEPSAVSGRPPVDASWRGVELIPDGPASYVQIRAPFETASGTVTWRVWRPGDSLISGIESTAGLSADADTALPRVEDVVLVALIECYDALANRSSGRPIGQWRQKARDQRQRVMQQHAIRIERGDRTLELAAAQAAQQQEAA